MHLHTYLGAFFSGEEVPSFDQVLMDIMTGIWSGTRLDLRGWYCAPFEARVLTSTIPHTQQVLRICSLSQWVKEWSGPDPGPHYDQMPRHWSSNHSHLPHSPRLRDMGFPECAPAQSSLVLPSYQCVSYRRKLHLCRPEYQSWTLASSSGMQPGHPSLTPSLPALVHMLVSLCCYGRGLEAADIYFL